jgi:hypothetical protein
VGATGIEKEEGRKYFIGYLQQQNMYISQGTLDMMRQWSSFLQNPTSLKSTSGELSTLPQGEIIKTNSLKPYKVVSLVSELKSIGRYIKRA